MCDKLLFNFDLMIILNVTSIFGEYGVTFSITPKFCVEIITFFSIFLFAQFMTSGHCQSKIGSY